MNAKLYWIFPVSLKNPKARIIAASEPPPLVDKSMMTFLLLYSQLHLDSAS